MSADEGARVGGICLWESRDAAEQFYDDASREPVTAAYGSPPVMTWFDTPVVVDNRHDELLAANV